MVHHARILAGMTFVLFGVVRELPAGGIHIRYGPDAPEKLAVANEKFYEGALRFDERHPAEFEHEHPFYAKLFNDPIEMNNLVLHWEAHEQRFEYLEFPLVEDPGRIPGFREESSSSDSDPTCSSRE